MGRAGDVKPCVDTCGTLVKARRAGADGRMSRWAVTFDSTPSRSGVIGRSCLARMTMSHSGSNFFQPAA